MNIESLSEHSLAVFGYMKNNLAIEDPEFVHHLVIYFTDKFPEPGFSDYTEIIIEALCDEWITEPVEYIHLRYEIPRDAVFSIVYQLSQIKAL